MVSQADIDLAYSSYFHISNTFPEWLIGTITKADLEFATWSVEYDNGDVDTDLCRRCVRSVAPLEVDTRVI